MSSAKEGKQHLHYVASNQFDLLFAAAVTARERYNIMSKDV